MSPLTKTLLAVYIIAGIANGLWASIFMTSKDLKLVKRMELFFLSFLLWPLFLPVAIIPEFLSYREEAPARRLRRFVRILAHSTPETLRNTFPILRPSDATNIRDSASDILKEREARVLNHQHMASTFRRFENDILFKSAKETVSRPFVPFITNPRTQSRVHLNCVESGCLSFTNTFFESLAWLSPDERSVVLNALIRIDDRRATHPYHTLKLAKKNADPKLVKLVSPVKSYPPALVSYPAGDWMVVILADWHSPHAYVLTMAKWQEEDSPVV